MKNLMSEKSWAEQLLMACSHEDESLEKEQQFWREKAMIAPIEELELFLSMPSGRFEEQARAVMAQVFRQRSAELEKIEIAKQGRIEWWRDLAGKISAQVIATIILALIVGFITGVWFAK